MDVFIGLDVSLASTSICVLDEKCKIVTEARVASAPEALVGFLRKLPHRIATVGLEAGPLSHWLFKGMTDAGFEAVLMETRQVKGALKAMPIKTDRRDRACRLLMTMPGVGQVIALTYTSAIDDPERFHRSKDVGPWVGLTPGRDQSGERDIVGRITKAGDAGFRR